MDRYDAVILGAGPSGLAAAHGLATQGAHAVVVERSPFVGGLMRGVQRGGFALDLGRKELYSRFPEVHSLWTEMLGGDYRPYPHRVGVLFGGRILEKAGQYQGPLRGMPLTQAGWTAASALWSQVKPGSRRVTSMEDYCVLRCGRAYYNYFVYGFSKKFEGHDPNQLPGPRHVKDIPRFAILRNRNASSNDNGGPPNGQERWYHPARGTQQIADALWRASTTKGVEFLLNTEVRSVNVHNGQVRSVSVRTAGVDRTLDTRYAIVSMPAPLIFKLLLPEPPAALREPPREDLSFKKSTALVYLMAKGSPKFPHNWLEVTDMRLRVGRVVNYGTWQGEMVPKGQTALCLEYFAVEGDDLMRFSKDELLKLAVREAKENGLIDDARIFDSLVIQLPAVNAATVFTDWRTDWMVSARDYLHKIDGLLDTNRPGIDRAVLAGLDAAAACVSGNPMSGRSLLETPGWE